MPKSFAQISSSLQKYPKNYCFKFETFFCNTISIDFVGILCVLCSGYVCLSVPDIYVQSTGKHKSDGQQ